MIKCTQCDAEAKYEIGPYRLCDTHWELLHKTLIVRYTGVYDSNSYDSFKIRA